MNFFDRILASTALALALPLSAGAGSSAARVTDAGQPGFHTGSSILAGSSNVFINGLPAAPQGAPTTCPQFCFTPTPIPHSPGSVTSASMTVRINGVGAARLGDTIVEPATPGQCQPVHSVSTGSFNVFIGP